MGTRQQLRANKQLASALTAVAAVAITAMPAAASDGTVRLLGETVVPHALDFQGTTVGGLSGIDFDPRSGNWVFISDDRSEKQPSRFYTARIDVGEHGVGKVRFTGTKPFLRPGGTIYPPLSAGDGTTVDPEDIRFDPRSGGLWWSSEGDRGEQVIDPSIRDAGRDGAYLGELPLPANLKMTPDAGPRRNEAIEGLTFAMGGALLVNSIEGSLLQDGESPTPEHGAMARLTAQDRQGKVIKQVAYPLDKVFAQSPAGGFSNNGISSILAMDQQDPYHYLVLERSFVTGVGNSIRIYKVDARPASDVQDIRSLKGASFTPLRKELVVDLSTLGLSTVDNVEGMTWGPRLASGERTLVLVSDDNFSDKQKAQIIALAVR